jgi:hypothetical protein
MVLASTSHHRWENIEKTQKRCTFGKETKHKTARGEEKTGPCGRNSLPAYKTLDTINEDLKPAEVDDWN